MTFPEKLHELRVAHNLSSPQLAAAVGVSAEEADLWEAGTKEPSIAQLITLGNFFGVTVDSLVKEEQTILFSQTVLHHPPSPSPVHAYPKSKKLHFEYKSQKTLGNIPLVHINVGLGAYTAKGIIAIGNIAIGLASIGGISIGALSMGLLTLGLLSLGCISVGVVAVGGFALGVLAMGIMSIGVYSLGFIALGHYAQSFLPYLLYY